MDLRQLSYVVAVADHGGFTRAAEAVHVTQPALSQAVRTLEAELGVELFHRTGRSVVLTAAGEALLGPARRALRDAETARAAVAEVAGLAAGHLDVVCLPTLAVDPAAGLVGRFRSAHPGVTVRLVEPDEPSAVPERVRSGASELGLAELPFAGDDLVTHELATQDFVAVLPPPTSPDGRSVAGRPITLAALARSPIVTTSAGTSTRRQLDEALATAGLEVTIVVETDHREALVALVLAGAGASLLPAPLAAAAAVGGAVVRPVTPRVRRRVGLVHRDGPLSPAAAAFVALALGDDAGSPGRPTRPRPRRR